MMPDPHTSPLFSWSLPSRPTFSMVPSSTLSSGANRTGEYQRASPVKQ
jgi:hypothetical protein